MRGLGRRSTRVCALLAAMLLVPAFGGTAVAKKKKPGAVKTRSATTSAAGNGAVLSATATCPKNTKAVGGGFSETPLDTAGGVGGWLYESVKVGQKSWRVSAQMTDSGPPNTISLTTFVYCRKHEKATSLVTAAGTKPAVAQVGPPVTATCTGKKNARAGGFQTGLPVTGPGTLSGTVTDSYLLPSKSWLTQLISGSTGTNTVSSIAYCATGKAPLAVTTVGTPNAAHGTTSTASATCAGKKRGVGGGFSGTGTTTTLPGGFFNVHEAQLIDKKTWRVSGVKLGGAQVSLNAIGVCA